MSSREQAILELLKHCTPSIQEDIQNALSKLQATAENNDVTTTSLPDVTVPKVPLQTDVTPSITEPAHLVDDTPEMNEQVISDADMKEEYIKQLHSFAWWDPTGNEWSQTLKQFLSTGGLQAEADAIQTACAKAKKESSQICGRIYAKKITDKKDPQIRQVRVNNRPFIAQINHDIQRAFQKVANKVANQQKNYTIPVSQNLPIYQQEPQSQWVLLIDETGSRFNADDDIQSRQESKFVGVLIPQNTKLKELDAHGTEMPDAKLHEAFSYMLQQQSISIFGLTLEDIPMVSGHQWIDGICELIAWVMRLLPLNGKTHLDVRIEQRPPHKAGSEQSRLERLLLQALVRVDPERADQTNLTVRFIKKFKSDQIRSRRTRRSETHPWLAYADIAAYMWGTNKNKYQKWLQKSKLLNHALHYNIRHEHLTMLDLLNTNQLLSGDLWNTLLRSLSETDSHLIDHLNQQWQIHTARTPKLWTQLLNHTLAHVHSKAINMNLLVSQVDWLNKVNQMSVHRLSAKEQLVFDMVRLATHNHLGEILDIKQDLAKFRHDIQQLKDEDARLSCFMSLHLAVQLTHFYAFQHAQNLAQTWLKEATPMIGLNLRGRTLSTMGQQYAFQHDYPKAIDYFTQAIDTFARLSCPNERLREQTQTRTYKVITMMDAAYLSHQPFDTSIVEEELLLLTSASSPTEACNLIAPSSLDAHKYFHHTFVRYLYLHNPTSLVDQYLALESKWTYGEKHPWPWINAYRALLLLEQDPTSEKAAKWLSRAIEGCSFKGIESIVGVSFLLIGRHYGIPDCTEAKLDKAFETLQTEATPQKVISRLTLVRTESWQSPRNWLPEVLPFNFH